MLGHLSMLKITYSIQVVLVEMDLILLLFCTMVVMISQQSQAIV